MQGELQPSDEVDSDSMFGRVSMEENYLIPWAKT